MPGNERIRPLHNGTALAASIYMEDITLMNMEKKRLFKIPLLFILLDIVGTLCLLLGLYDYFASGERLLPMSLQFQYYEFTLMMIGGLLMLPLVTMLLEMAHFGNKQPDH